MASGDPEIEVSPLSGTVTRDGVTVELAIYRMAGANEGWTLEVVDATNTSTVWDDRFETDDEASAEFQRCLDEEGIELLLAGDVAPSLH
ncbi:hypothetical protein [Aureimonas pseudogalii]|uniref:Uncharacterized protein n=1 Tax=Aureimonas pseudogalii TaxID=1744844 RepID=A0A7W6H7Z9_9HYPH|nr:hypothetical protein [Aureimonas pseudogalii]MBB4000314.1 hypothetical protein [Aureimonas pseudogalii]